ncbi:MAG: alpha-2-macroglobulin [Stappia sp.]|nr:alpha-2-macroglobulin [Stappia sp.]
MNADLATGTGRNADGPAGRGRKAGVRRFIAGLPRAASALLLLTGVVAGSLSAETARADERRIVTVEDADYFGADFNTLKEVDLDACKAACLSSDRCRAFTYNTSARWCFMKSDVGRLQSFAGAVAGRVVTVADAERAPVDRGVRENEISFLPRSTLQEAARYARTLPRSFRAGGSDVNVLAGDGEAALARGDNEGAERAFGRALTLDGDRHDLWQGLARSLDGQKPDDWSRKVKVRNDFIAAAVNTYLVSAGENDRADALALLADALARSQTWKPAIKALRASLALQETPDRRARYDDMVAEHGFRILEHNVESDALSPRICLVFSDTLRRATDMAPFVRVTGEGPYSIEAEGAQICIDGVAHGGRYSVLVRQGVPSADGEELEKSSDLTVYVRDRSPSVSFLGNAYVLPAGDGATIPLRSVNTETVDAEIYRIGDRALASALRDRRALIQLDNYRAEQVREEYGEALWKGTVETEMKLNRDVTTAVPVAEFGLTMTPGIYAMVARAPQDRENTWGPWATQWFLVSDLGITSYTGEGEAVVALRRLSDARAVEGASVRLIAVNNDILGETKSDADGFARFAPGLLRGKGGRAPALVSVETDSGDYAFLDLGKPAFDLSDRGAEGRPAPGPLDAFAWTDRGVYRPGETVHVGAMLRDRAAFASPDIPLTLIYMRPDGVEQTRVTVADAGAGGRAHAFEVPASAQTGSWSLRVHADPKADPLAQLSFLVEDFQPERVDFTLETDAEALDPTDLPEISLQAKFLYGAPASGQRLEGEVVVSPSRSRADAPGYVFGLADEQIFPDRASLADGTVTDDEGRASFTPVLPQLQPTTAGYDARITARVVEAGGRYVERSLELPVVADGLRIGVKPAFEDGVDEGGPAEFDVIALGADGERAVLQGANWELSRLSTRYQWYRNDGRWSYEPITTTKRVANGTLDIDAGTPARLSLPVEWGRYRLEVIGTDPESGAQAATSTEFTAGWYVSSASSQTPDVLEVGLDRKSYKVGDTASLRMKPRVAGTVLVSVMTDRLVDTRVVNVEEGETSVDLTVTDAWGSGAYVTATLFRPMDLEARRMPSRALGLNWAAVDPGARKHTVELDVPERIRPRSRLDVGVTISGQGADEPAFVTIAAVDVGILNLTRFKTPDPDGWYFGQRRLGMEIRDYYGALIDRTAGELGKVRSGGDGMGLSLDAPPPQEALMALFSGVVETDADGKATVGFDIPDFNGTVRLMAVAWSASGVGHGERDVIVRDPLVMTATLPRFLAPGDETRLLVEVDNVEGEAGDYRIAADVEGPLELSLAPDGLGVTLDKGERRALEVPIRAASGTGDASIRLTLQGPDGPLAEKSLALGIRDNTPPMTRRSFVTLASAGSLDLNADTLAGIRPEGARISVAAGGPARINIPGLLAALDRYPYGCTEQTTSRALPLLYLNELALSAGLDTDAAVRERVQKAIARVLGNQDGSGAFGLWSAYGAGRDTWLDAYVTDFLSRARDKGYDVPELAYSQALEGLENRVAYASDFSDGGTEIAYALYVLARTGRASLGDLRYYADVKLDDFGSPMAKAQIGAALALYGETERAERALKAAVTATGDLGGTDYRADFGTSLRDAAGVLAYVTEAGFGSRMGETMAERVARRQEEDATYSTQEMAWLLMAGHELLQSASEDSFTLDGRRVSTPLALDLAGDRIAAEGASLVNEGGETANVVVSVSGRPVRPEPAGGNGYQITREYYDLDGNRVDPADVALNTRIVVVLNVTSDRLGRGRLLVVDRLPAGLVIDNPRLVRGGDLGGLDWLDPVDNADHAEFRDDRFAVAIDQTRLNADGYTFAYLARASLPGSFALPPATVEDMYRPGLSATTATGRFEVKAP